MTYIKTGERAARGARTRSLGALLVSALLGAGFVVACGESTNGLLTVTNPNAVPSKLWQDPANATLMVNSVIGDFECAYGSFVVAEGMASNELQDATLANTNWNLNRRDEGFYQGAYGTNGCTSSTGVYTPLSTARQEADVAIKQLAAFTAAQVPNLSSLVAQANLYAGFSYATLGMSMCQAAFDLGPLVSQAGMFALAESRFTAAIAAAQTAGLTNVLNAAYGGRARVRWFQNNGPGAISDANQVPAGFVFNAAMDATNPRRFNHVYQAIATAGTQTVDPTVRALKTENGQLDPRAAVTLLTTAPADAASVIYIPTKYNAASITAGDAIPMPIVRYAEAQLILAEAQGGAAAVAIVNAMRAAVQLSPYTGPTDAASIRLLMAGERQRVLFLEGFHGYDVERFNLPLVPAIGAPYLRGGAYGGTVCLPIPLIESSNNPSIDVTKIISGIRGQFPAPVP